MTNDKDRMREAFEAALAKFGGADDEFNNYSVDEGSLFWLYAHAWQARDAEIADLVGALEASDSAKRPSEGARLELAIYKIQEMLNFGYFEPEHRENFETNLSRIKDQRQWQARDAEVAELVGALKEMVLQFESVPKMGPKNMYGDPVYASDYDKCMGMAVEHSQYILAKHKQEG